MSEELFIGNAYLNRLSKIKDPLAQVVTIHLFTEFWLDKILESRCEKPNALPNQINYKQKLDIVHSLVVLPEGLYDNLWKLNKLRNKCAHNLNFDFSNADYNYDLSTVLDIDKNFGRDLSKCDLWDRLMWIGVITFGWLNNYAINKLGLNNMI